MAFVSELVRNNIKYILIMAIVILLFVLIILLKKVIRKKQKNKELRQAAEDKLRDENLNNVILNSHAESKHLRGVHVPYDVDYSNPRGDNKNHSDHSKKENGHVMLQLVEKTELSTRKFMLNPAKKIYIGSDLQNNDIAVLDENISLRQCEIFAVKDKIYIRNLSHENQTILRRKKEQAIVDEKGLRMLSGDNIILGNVTYEVTIKD